MLTYEVNHGHDYDVMLSIQKHTPTNILQCIIYVSQAKREGESLKVSGVSWSILHQCPVEDMWLWLCRPRGSLQTVPCVSRASQGLNSGAQLRPPNWETNLRRSVGTSCLTGPWPRGARPVSGSCTVLWPTYKLMGGWQSCSYIWSSMNFTFRQQFHCLQC